MDDSAERAADLCHTPTDDFPPFGYLDNPYHSWKLNPCGVLRSRPPCGMGWHVPNYGSYGRSQFAERAHLHVGLEVGELALLQPADFRAAGVSIGCDLHTAHRLRYVWTHPAGVRVAATYFLISQDALGCLVELERQANDGASEESSAEPPQVRLWLAQELAHDPATSRLWEHGIYALPPGTDEPETGAAGLLGICPEGGAWVHGTAGPDGQPLPPAEARGTGERWEAGAEDTLPRGREPEALQTAILGLAYDVALAAGERVVARCVLSRGASPDAALAAWRVGLADFEEQLAAHAAADGRFWAGAPKLTGDWPGHVRRGMATDLETLRMVTRPAAGVFGGAWDGMQIQAPRGVLAETALDALALAWADPATACGILLECFSSAPRPNVPCLREDGSYNMISDDGAICGTGPEWGWPFAVIEALWRRSGDRAWLAALYPHAAAYADWWLAHRRDAGGWLVHACSWESGQDVSTRFGSQSTGGSDVRHLRPVDLQAAMAQASALLAGWAEVLERPEEEAARWREEAEAWAARTRAMWRGNWCRDYDTAAGRWSEVRDPMQLAPLAGGVASAEQRRVLRGAFASLPKHCGVYPPLVWPPVAQTALEAALAAGQEARAAELAAGILDRVWRRMDARTLEPDGALPGVTREYWPEGGRGTSAGIEGYGWGALTVHFLVRYLVGLREDSPTSFRLVPALPAAWRRRGACYTIGRLPYGGRALTLTYRLPADAAVAKETLDIELAVAGTARPLVARDAQDQRVLARGEPAGGTGVARLAWRGAWLRAALISDEGPGAA
jgi:mannosylglycerate hydrolase MGH1-like protein